MYRLITVLLIIFSITSVSAQNKVLNKLTVRDTFSVLGQNVSDKFQIVSGGGDLEMWDFNYVIARTHAAE